jgi:hypothetical protein
MKGVALHGVLRARLLRFNAEHRRAHRRSELRAGCGYAPVKRDCCRGLTHSTICSERRAQRHLPTVGGKPCGRYVGRASPGVSMQLVRERNGVLCGVTSIEARHTGLPTKVLARRDCDESVCPPPKLETLVGQSLASNRARSALRMPATGRSAAF